MTTTIIIIATIVVLLCLRGSLRKGNSTLEASLDAAHMGVVLSAKKAVDAAGGAEALQEGMDLFRTFNEMK